MAKVTTTFDLGNLGRGLNKIITLSMNQWGNAINKRIQDGVLQGKDIHDVKFTPLEPVTKRMGGKNPLKRTGNMKKTKKLPSTGSDFTFTIKMDGVSARTGAFYGAFHNEGYTNSLKKKQWFKGATIPKREWFGVHKDLQPGGKDLEKIILFTRLQIEKRFAKRG